MGAVGKSGDKADVGVAGAVDPVEPQPGAGAQFGGGDHNLEAMDGSEPDQINACGIGVVSRQAGEFHGEPLRGGGCSAYLHPHRVAVGVSE